MQRLTLSALRKAAADLAGRELSDLIQNTSLNHRGKGRGSPNRAYGNKPGKHLPHQANRECARRRRQMEVYGHSL